MSAFFLYSQANRARVKEENPSASFGEIVSLACYNLFICCCCYAISCVIDLSRFDGIVETAAFVIFG
jgi:hypothetical protein